VVFYQLITGQRPFDGTTPNALIYQHNFEEPTAPKEIDNSITDEIQAVVIKLLSKKSENRYVDADHLVNDLHNIQEGVRLEALLAEKLSTGADEARKENLSWAQRNLLKIVAGVAATLLAAGGYAWYDYQQKRTADQIQRTSDRAEAKIATNINDIRLNLKKYLDGKNEIPTAVHADLATFITLVEKNPELSNKQDTTNITTWQKKISTVSAIEIELIQLIDNNSKEFLLFADNALAKERILSLKNEIGSNAENIIRWDAVVISTDAHIEKSRNNLKQIDALTGRMSLNQRQLLQIEIDAIRPLIEDSDNLDQNIIRWNAIFSTFDSKKDRLEASLSKLSDSTILLTEPLRIKHQGDLDHLQIMLGNKHRTIQSYQNILDIALAETQTLNIDLKNRLGHSNKHLVSIVEEITYTEKLNRLINLQGISAAHKKIYEDRLLLEKSKREDLRKRLLVFNQSVPISNTQKKNIRDFYEVVGKNDPDALRWHSKLLAVEDLKTKLVHLNEITPVLADSRNNLTALIAEVGTHDGDVISWSIKLDRVENNTNFLAHLDEARSIDPRSQLVLNDLKRDIGSEDQRIIRWGKKISIVKELKSDLAQVPGNIILPVDTLKKQLHNLKTLVGNVGLNDSDLGPWAQHLSLLRGPGRPIWASDFGRDNFGLWAEMRISNPKFTDVHSLTTFEIDPNSNQTLNDDNSVALRFRFIPAGNFKQGAGEHDSLRDSDETQIEATLTSSYWIADMEVTQAIWFNITGRNPSKFKGQRNPVERISWADTQNFMERMRTQYPEVPVRLPSEAEWERACKGGIDDLIYGGPQGKTTTASVDDIAWHKNNALQKTHIAGVRQPNRLGLHDMHGNVWEWCQDGYNEYPTQDAIDHIGFGEKNVARGGSWGDEAFKLRSSNRLAVKPSMKSSYLGLRLAVNVEWKNQHEPDGNQLLAQANDVFEQFQIDQQITSNIRLFFQVEWPKVSADNTENASFEDIILAPSLRNTPNPEPVEDNEVDNVDDKNAEQSEIILEIESENQSNSSTPEVSHRKKHGRRRGSKSQSNKTTPVINYSILEDVSTADLISIVGFENKTDAINSQQEYGDLDTGEIIDLLNYLERLDVPTTANELIIP
ncbi:MAG: SUMF1/EgtB/PvdO family nonheme iron enzyme, partial [Planctomycetes bacterium]|nr:SUMF1/EgtB/PvdO family nonheme iron enzyme [Planctomycetota bacterium]